MRVPYEAIHVISYVLKVNTVEEVILELATSSYYYGYPIHKAISLVQKKHEG